MGNFSSTVFSIWQMVYPSRCAPQSIFCSNIFFSLKNCAKNASTTTMMMVSFDRSIRTTFGPMTFWKMNCLCHLQHLHESRGQFHKTLWIHKLRICSHGQIVTVNLLINCKNCISCGKMAVNYEEKSFMELGPRSSFVDLYAPSIHHMCL